MWACHSTMYKYNREGFEKKFLEVTNLTVDSVLISTGGIGFNFMSPGWRNLSRVLARNIVYTIFFLLILSCNERKQKALYN